MVDRIAAVAWVMSIWLDMALRIRGPRQQDVSPRLGRRRPIHLPASPRISSSGIHEFRLDPPMTAVGRHFDASDLSFAGPCRAGNRVDAVWFESFEHSRPGNLGLDLHFCQRPPDRHSIELVPITVV